MSSTVERHNVLQKSKESAKLNKLPEFIAANRQLLLLTKKLSTLSQQYLCDKAAGAEQYVCFINLQHEIVASQVTIAIAPKPQWYHYTFTRPAFPRIASLRRDTILGA